MAGIRSFNDSMALDRGILETLNSPLANVPLPENKSFTPPGALRGVVDDSFELTSIRLDAALSWAIETPATASVMTPSGFQSALGNAAGRLSAAAREASSDPGAQGALRACTRLVTEQLELMKLAEFNRSALMQG